jgi:hypothetical protein
MDVERDYGWKAAVTLASIGWLVFDVSDKIE